MSPGRKWITLKIPSSAAFRANLAQRFQNKNCIQHHTPYGNVSCWHGLGPQRLLVFRAHICWRVVHLISIFVVFISQINEGSQTCSSCGTRLSEYFCFKCKHFTGVDKNPFHCDKCGICRYVVSVLHFILFYCIYFFLHFNVLSVYVFCLSVWLLVYLLFVLRGLCKKNFHVLLRLPDSDTD